MTDAQRTSVLCTVTFTEGLRFFDDERSIAELAEMADRVIERAAANGKLAGVSRAQVIWALRAECERRCPAKV